MLFRSDMARAQKYGRILLNLNPQSAPALKALALVALESRDFGIASGYFFRAVELEPEILDPGPARRGGANKNGDYRIDRGTMENLTEAARRQPGVSKRAAGAR